MDLSFDPKSTKVILIGVSIYKSGFTDIKPVERNLNGLKQVLENTDLIGIPSKNIVIIKNETSDKIVQKIIHAIDKSVKTLIIYYAGHGYRTSTKKLFLTGANSNADNDLIEFSGIEYSKLQKIIEKFTGIDNRLFVLDACYSGTAAQSDTLLTEDERIIKGTYVFTSSAANEQSFFNNKQEYTFFTSELISTLTKGDKNAASFLTISEVFENVRQNMFDKFGASPQQKNNLTSQNFYFAKNPQSLIKDKITEADKLFENEKYNEALSKYISIQKELNNNYINSKINNCNSEILRLQKLEEKYKKNSFLSKNQNIENAKTIYSYLLLFGGWLFLNLFLFDLIKSWAFEIHKGYLAYFIAYCFLFTLSLLRLFQRRKKLHYYELITYWLTIIISLSGSLATYIYFEKQNLFLSLSIFSILFGIFIFIPLAFAKSYLNLLPKPKINISITKSKLFFFTSIITYIFILTLFLYKSFTYVETENFKSYFEGKAIGWRNKKVGFIDSTERFVIEPQFLDAHHFKNGLAAVKSAKNMNWGYIDTSGIVIIDFDYDEAQSFEKYGFANVTQGKNNFYIDRKGNKINGKLFKDYYLIFEEFDKYGVINNLGDTIVPANYNKIIDISTPWVSLVDQSGYILYNVDTKTKLSLNADKILSFFIKTKKNVIIPAKIKQKWAFLDTLGYAINGNYFDSIVNFVNGSRFAPVKNNNKWAIINDDIKVISSYCFDSIRYFNRTLNSTKIQIVNPYLYFPAKLENHKWGLINFQFMSGSNYKPDKSDFQYENPLIYAKRKVKSKYNNKYYDFWLCIGFKKDDIDVMTIGETPYAYASELKRELLKKRGK